MSIMGEDDEEIGEMLYGSEVGRARALMGRVRAGQRIRVPAKPQWRNEVAPGVGVPGIGLEPLPLQPARNNGIFDAATPEIFFEARPQRPFRAERLIASVRRSAGAGAIVILGQTIVIGTQVAQVDLGAFDLEFFAATAFDTRLNLPAATPGMIIRIPCQANPGVPVGETVAVSILMLGRTIR